MDAQNKIANLAMLAERSLKQNLVARHPELLRAPNAEDDARNEQAVDSIFLERVNAGEWEFNDANYEAAYAVALNEGRLNLLPESEPAAETIEQLYDKGAGALREYFEKQETPRPPNMAEFLTGEGSYRWKRAQPDIGMDEQALAALLASVKGTP